MCSVCVCVCVCVCVKVAQSCLTVCDPMDYKVHGILQARILEWVAFPFSRGSSQPRDATQVSRMAGQFFTSWATREAQITAPVTCNCLLHFYAETLLMDSIQGLVILDLPCQAGCESKEGWVGSGKYSLCLWVHQGRSVIKVPENKKTT